MISEHVFYDFEGEDQAMPPAYACPSPATSGLRGSTRTSSSPASLKI